MRLVRSTAVASSILVAALLLAACAPTAPMPVPTVSASPSLSPGEEDLPDATPELRPDGTALQNQLYFESVIAQYHAANGVGTADALVGALVAAGFDKSAMEVTPEYTSIGLAADSVIVSVRIQDQCLLGQVFGDRYSTIIAPVLGTGRCMVGETHPIS